MTNTKQVPALNQAQLDILRDIYFGGNRAMQLDILEKYDALSLWRQGYLDCGVDPETSWDSARFMLTRKGLNLF